MEISGIKSQTKIKRKERDLDDRHLTAKHQNSAHLEKDSESVPYIISVEFFKALGAVPSLEEESIPHGGFTQAFLKAPGLSGEHNRREIIQGFQHRFQLLPIRIFRQLKRLLRLPAVQSPFPRNGGLSLDADGDNGGFGGGRVGRVDS